MLIGGNAVMKVIEKTAKTTDEAIELALKELKVTRQDVEVEILEQGSRGLFGLIGAKDATVRVTYKVDYAKKAEEFLSFILKKMDVDFEIQSTLNKGILNISISGPKMGRVIGSRGETLDCLQFLTSLHVNKDSEEQHVRVILDVENYRNKRQETLTNLANKLATIVKKTGRKKELEPMNAYERRIIHSALEANTYVETHSVGDEPNRRIVITLKR